MAAAQSSFSAPYQWPDGVMPKITDHVQMPEGPQGQRVQALIEAFNAGQPAALQAFYAKYGDAKLQDAKARADNDEDWLRLRLFTLGVDFYSVRTYEPPDPDTVIVVRDRIFGEWHAFSLTADPDASGRLSEVEFGPARASPDLPAAKPLDEEQLVQQLQADTKKACDTQAFSGALLLAQGRKVLFSAACGEASRRYHVPNTLDTRFNLGSMNKMFTAVSVAQLVLAGKLSYDDHLDKWLDDSWLPKDVSSRITVRQLLTHTSGLGSYFSPKFMDASRTLYRDPADYKPLVHDDKPAFEPGTKFQYSNSGMLLLGVVVEKASGENYFDYVRAHVYAPAGMHDTDSYPMDEPFERVATGYTRSYDSDSAAMPWRENTFLHVIRGGPAGGGYSTVGDLHRFALALLDGKLLPREALQPMWTDEREFNYGYGFEVHDTDAGKVVGHSGGFPGVNGQLDIYVDKGWIFAALANQDGMASEIANHLQHEIGAMKK